MKDRDARNDPPDRLLGRAGEHPMLVDVSLAPMTAEDLDAFIDEEVADYANERMRDGDWSRRDALTLARLELGRVIAWEHEAATSERQRLLTARDRWGERIGWLWVKLGPSGSWSTDAFLCQMTVARACRHRGHGRSMLAALEAFLADEGITELRLNVYESNLAAKCLYDAAGYSTVAQYPTMRLLRKRLGHATQRSPTDHGNASDWSSTTATPT